MYNFYIDKWVKKFLSLETFLSSDIPSCPVHQNYPNYWCLIRKSLPNISLKPSFTTHMCLKLHTLYVMLRLYKAEACLERNEKKMYICVCLIGSGARFSIQVAGAKQYVMWSCARRLPG